MINRFVLLSALICLTVAQIDQQVRYYVLNDATLIETARGYAINAPTLLANNWKAVSVNGDSVQVYSPTCQVSSMSRQELMNSAQQQNLLNAAKQALYAAERGQNQLGGQTIRMGSARFSLTGNSISTSGLANSNFNSNGVSMSKFDDNNMSISKPAGGLPDNLNRVFLSNDLVTFVYQDGRVLMKPASCLTASEQQLVQQLRAEVQEAKRKFDVQMQQFQQNMQNMQHSMQMNMQNMHQSLNSMFQPGFPFHANQQQQQQQHYGFNQNSNMFGSGLPFGSGHAFAGGMQNGGAAAYAQAGGLPAASGASWPFGSNNSPFYPGFPFGR